MKKLVKTLIIMNLLVLMLIAALLYVAETYPYHPGDLLYQVQRTAEYWKLQLTSGKRHQADFAIDIADRRLADLAQLEEEESIVAGANVFNQALNEAVLRIEAAPESFRDPLYGRLKALLRQAEVVFKSLDSRIEHPVIRGLSYKISQMEDARTSAEMVASLPPQLQRPTNINAEVIPFLNQDVDHVDFQINRHDLSKLGPKEFVQYRRFFYPTDEEYTHWELFAKKQFEDALQHHLDVNPHHSENKINHLPANLVEMVVDWYAMYLEGGTPPRQWYETRKDRIVLDEEAEKFLYKVLDRIEENNG